MKEIVLKARPREKVGKEYAKKLRRNGFIPAVVYGQGASSLALEIETKSFHALLRRGLGENVLVNLSISDHKDGEKKVLIRETQRDPVKGDIIHVDFHEISLTRKLAIQVPIHLMGTPEGVKEGGILQHVLRELEVECLPTAIPEKIEVDVNHLKIGDSIHVSDLRLEDVEILSDPHSSIVSVVPPTVFKEPEAAPVAAEEEPEVITEKKEEEEEEKEKEKEEKKETKAEKKPAEGGKEEQKKDQK
ncbi:MAG: 50S ribosomal protein L25/general stress protein Ctc [candidate division Zixibacteria bacterium]|nr:50S ribosomal protein L25/general stress protein Ctc [candidate division Zixibacteria bacterium]